MNNHRGGDGGDGGRAEGRFAFINAVMAHARDGGDPLDIEEACTSGGFEQDEYNGTPQTTSTQEEVRASQWSPCDPMSSGNSVPSSNGLVDEGG